MILLSYEDFSVDSDTTGVLSSLDTVSVFLGPHAVNDIATIRAVARSHAGFFIVIILPFLIFIRDNTSKYLLDVLPFL